MILKSCGWKSEDVSYPIQVHSDARTGHLIYKSHQFEKLPAGKVETLIVGGGMAGMAAACRLKDRDFLLCELSGDLGGTSSAYRTEKLTFAQGAHYDMGYPGSYGHEVLELLETLNIIRYQPWKDSWGFADQQYLVMHRRKNQCYDHGQVRREVLMERPLRNDFFRLMESYRGEMHLPTRLIDDRYHKLNRISFINFLHKQLKLNDQFIRGLNYHLKDDYGANAYAVSALAGIHYFTCRPYNSEIVELFSPPQGNHYFIQRMADYVGNERLKTRHLVKRITKEAEGFRVEVVDIMAGVIHVFKAKKIIYAGQKHALKYIFPQDYSLFSANHYSPWMVVNLVLEPIPRHLGYWQNEMLTKDETFLGFIDSSTQSESPDESLVLTAYYCLPEASRNDLIQVEANKQRIVKTTAQHISKYFGWDIQASILQVDIKVMGHAMPVPGVGHLFDDKNQYRKNKNMIYAGVDNSRLPLLFEAVDSGILAATMV